jgi:hypothetical protein
MKFMLFTYRDPNIQPSPEQRATIPPAVAAWCDEPAQPMREASS